MAEEAVSNGSGVFLIPDSLPCRKEINAMQNSLNQEKYPYDVRNKRHSVRYRSAPTLTYQYSLFSEKYRARGFNHSEDGISFECANEIKPGTIVFIRRNECIQGGSRCDNCTGCKAITFATIKWCLKVDGFPAERYRIGAKYLHTH